MRLVFPPYTAVLFVLSFQFLPGITFAQKGAEPKVVSGTVLLNEKLPPDFKAVMNSLRTEWKLKSDSVNMTDKTVVFSTSGGVSVMIAFLNYPAAMDEVGAAARLSWIWKTAAEECSRQQAQVVISVIGPANRSLDLYRIFTQTAAAVLAVSHSPGIYLGSQYLLLSEGYFTAAARNMIQNQTIPLYCWVYFGRPGDGNGFTYGLTEFGLSEMEIVHSLHTEAEVHAALYDSALSVVKYGTLLKDGQSLTTEEGGQFKVQLQKGTYLEDKQVFKLDY